MSNYNTYNQCDHNRERYIPRDENRERYIPRDDRRDIRPREEPVTHPSICIPRTFTSIRGKPAKAAVFETLRDLRIGHIERIDVVHKTDPRGERFCTIYVHLQWNMRSDLARETRQKMLDKNDIKIVYDDPWFWKCTMSTMDKPDREGGNGILGAPKPRIDLGGGVKAVSRYTQDTRDERNQQHHHKSGEEDHNPEQLCNMDPYEESD
jgi:hypothetical protein